MLYQVKKQRGEPIAAGVPTLETGLTVDDNGAIEVEFTATITDRFIKRLNDAGAVIIASVLQYRDLGARVPLDQLESLAALDEVVWVRPIERANVWQAEPQMNDVPAVEPRIDYSPNVFDREASNSFHERAQRVRDFITKQLAQRPETGSVTSEGDATHKANLARSTFGANGSGVRIGVLSNGVVSLAASQALGDLGAVTVLPGQVGTGDEGTAMLEIVHDLAPGAQLYFATANPIIGAFAQNIRDLKSAGCNVIIDDVFYFNETPFQDGQTPSIVSSTNQGIVTQAVDDVTAQGLLYFSSAGNQGNLTDNTSSCYQGDFAGIGAAAPLPLTGTVHQFSAGVTTDLIQTGSGNQIDLYWSDPIGGSINDYDLYVVNNAGTTIVASSTNVQSGTQDPIEAVATGNTTNNRIVVFKKNGSADRFFQITINANGVGKLGTSTEGTTKGHGSSTKSVGKKRGESGTGAGPAE